MRRPLHSLLALLALLALGATVPAPASAAGCRGAGLTPTAANKAKIERATLCLLNRARAQRGLPKLRASRVLKRAARKHSANMDRRDFFSHVSPGGATVLHRVRAVGYLASASSFSVGENIAWGSGGRATPRAIHRAWMRSPGHRANILSRGFREIGVGVALGTPVSGLRGATYTQNFGRRG